MQSLNTISVQEAINFEDIFTQPAVIEDDENVFKENQEQQTIEEELIQEQELMEEELIKQNNLTERDLTKKIQRAIADLMIKNFEYLVSVDTESVLERLYVTNSDKRFYAKILKESRKNSIYDTITQFLFECLLALRVVIRARPIFQMIQQHMFSSGLIILMMRDLYVIRTQHESDFYEKMQFTMESIKERRRNEKTQFMIATLNEQMLKENTKRLKDIRTFKVMMEKERLEIKRMEELELNLQRLMERFDNEISVAKELIPDLIKRTMKKRKIDQVFTKHKTVDN